MQNSYNLINFILELFLGHMKIFFTAPNDNVWEVAVGLVYYFAVVLFLRQESHSV